jgi:hypothetical protein
MEYEGKCTIVRHCSVMGRKETVARKVSTGTIQRYAQHDRSVQLNFVEPRKRRGAAYVVVPDNRTFFEVVVDGKVLLSTPLSKEVVVDGKVIWDSRSEIPCDMSEWHKTNEKHKDHRPIRTFHNGIEELPPVTVLTPADRELELAHRAAELELAHTAAGRSGC